MDVTYTRMEQNWRLQPRTEALVRLRYARVLFEETDNDLDAETSLSKGVRSCWPVPLYLVTDLLLDRSLRESKQILNQSLLTSSWKLRFQ